MKHLSLFVIVSALLLTAESALAHTMLDRASPSVGSSLLDSPREVSLWFTEDLEPTFSQIEVRNESGVIVSIGKAQTNAADRTQLRVPLKSLPPGTYKVIWRVMSVDTHRTQGNFTFRVGQ